MNARSLLKNILLPASFLLLVLSQVTKVQAQAPNVRYNRFQYHKYHWEVLKTPAFQLYFPTGYDSLASFASLQLPDIMQETKKAMGRELQDPPNIIIYPSLTQSYEGNIGLHEDKIQTFPTINLKGNRMLVAFAGSYEQFRKQLKAAWVRMVWEETFKNDLEEQASNKRMLIPDWYKQGCILYFGEGCPLQQEEVLERIFSGHPNNWQALSNANPSIAGQAFCYFLSEKFREDACKQILFQMNAGKSLARAARLITKHTLNDLTAACFAFYQKRFAGSKAALSEQDSIIVKIKKAWPKEKVIGVKENPDKKTIAWVAGKNNRRTVYIQNRNKSSQRKEIIRYSLPPWISNIAEDPYPLLKWDDKGKILFVMLPEKGMIKVRKFTASGTPLDFRDCYVIRFTLAA